MVHLQNQPSRGSRREGRDCLIPLRRRSGLLFYILDSVGLLRGAFPCRGKYDPHCRGGRYPLDEHLGLQGAYSAGLEREMMLLGALMPYEMAAQVMARLMMAQASDDTLWRQVQASRERVRASDAECSRAPQSASPAPEVGQIQSDGGDHGRGDGAPARGGVEGTQDRLYV